MSERSEVNMNHRSQRSALNMNTIAATKELG
jgi:hypothetical protein